MNEWKGGAPNLYDISGSAHWHNKADVGIVVHRLFKEMMNNPRSDIKDFTKKHTTQIGIDKVKTFAFYIT